MEVCPFTEFLIYTIPHQIYVQFCLDLQIIVLLITFRHSTRVIVRLSHRIRASLLWMLPSLFIKDENSYNIVQLTRQKGKWIQSSVFK